MVSSKSHTTGWQQLNSTLFGIQGFRHSGPCPLRVHGFKSYCKISQRFCANPTCGGIQTPNSPVASPLQTDGTYPEVVLMWELRAPCLTFEASTSPWYATGVLAAWRQTFALCPHIDNGTQHRSKSLGLLLYALDVRRDYYLTVYPHDILYSSIGLLNL